MYMAADLVLYMYMYVDVCCYRIVISLIENKVLSWYFLLEEMSIVQSYLLFLFVKTRDFLGE